MSAHGIDVSTFEQPKLGYRFGVKPQLAEILTSISGVSFDEAWPDRVVFEIEGRTIPVIGREALRKNKSAAGRPKELARVLSLRVIE